MCCYFVYKNHIVEVYFGKFTLIFVVYFLYNNHHVLLHNSIHLILHPIPPPLTQPLFFCSLNRYLYMNSCIIISHPSIQRSDIKHFSPCTPASDAPPPNPVCLLRYTSHETHRSLFPPIEEICHFHVFAELFILLFVRNLIFLLIYFAFCIYIIYSWALYCLCFVLILPTNIILLVLYLY